jgi:hypothetical protein
MGAVTISVALAHSADHLRDRMNRRRANTTVPFKATPFKRRFRKLAQVCGRVARPLVGAREERSSAWLEPQPPVA